MIRLINKEKTQEIVEEIFKVFQKKRLDITEIKFILNQLDSAFSIYEAKSNEEAFKTTLKEFKEKYSNKEFKTTLKNLGKKAPKSYLG